MQKETQEIFDQIIAEKDDEKNKDKYEAIAGLNSESKVSIWQQ